MREILSSDRVVNFARPMPKLQQSDTSEPGTTPAITGCVTVVSVILATGRYEILLRSTPEQNEFSTMPDES